MNVCCLRVARALSLIALLAFAGCSDNSPNTAPDDAGTRADAAEATDGGGSDASTLDMSSDAALADTGTCSETGSAGVNACSDNSKWFFVRVRRTGEPDSCTSYQFEVSNGVYDSAG